MTRVGIMWALTDVTVDFFRIKTLELAPQGTIY